MLSTWPRRSRHTACSTTMSAICFPSSLFKLGRCKTARCAHTRLDFHPLAAQPHAHYPDGHAPALLASEPSP